MSGAAGEPGPHDILVENPAGYPTAIEEKVRASDLNGIAKSGRRTRLLRFAPGGFTVDPFVHDHWEEVHVISGELTVGSNLDG